MKPTLSTRLKELRKERNLTQKQLSTISMIGYGSIVDYENGRREPNAKAMVALERFFGVTGEYLRGETDEREPIYKWQDREIMGAVNRALPSKLSKLSTILSTSSDLEKKMVFDILVEISHILSSDSFTERQKQSAFILLQESIAISTTFADECASASRDREIEEPRLKNSIRSLSKRFNCALDVLMDDFIDDKVSPENYAHE